MKTFYEALNKWQKDDRIGRWSIYRSCITDYVLKNIDKSKAERPVKVLLVGAGGCEDIGLKHLVDSGLELTLTDIDEESMVEAVQREGLEGVEIQGFDYLGISDLEILEDYASLCRTGGSFIEFANAVESLVEISSEMIWATYSSYDVVICMPLYTQLFFFYMSELLYEGLDLSVIDEETFLGIRQLQLEGMPKIIDGFNRNLLEQLKSDGQLFVFSDLIEDKIDGPYIEAYEDGSGIDQIVDAYVSAYGMGLGNYGLYSLEDKCHRVNHQWFLWPFDEKRSMIVQGVLYNKL